MMLSQYYQWQLLSDSSQTSDYMVTNLVENHFKDSQTCIKRSPLGQRKSGLIRQVTS
jgi:hypothetical protein